MCATRRRNDTAATRRYAERGPREGMHQMDRQRHDTAYVPPLPHRGAPADEVSDTRWPRIRPSQDVLLGGERMDGEGGGSAPMHDGPEDGDLRFLRGRLAALERDGERFGHWP